MSTMEPEAQPAVSSDQDSAVGIAIPTQALNKRSGGRGHTGHRIGEWHGRAKYADATVRMARELYAEIRSYESVGYLLNIPKSTVVSWIRGDARRGSR